MQRHWETNTLGPLYLFQSFYPLLLKSTKAEKKFIITSTLAGSLTAAVPFPLTAYGSSKAAINFVGIHIHQEHAEKDKIAVVLVHPGESSKQDSYSPIGGVVGRTAADLDHARTL